MEAEDEGAKGGKVATGGSEVVVDAGGEKRW